MRDGDYCDEISVAEDHTLTTTHLGVSASVAAVVDLWGGAYVALCPSRVVDVVRLLIPNTVVGDNFRKLLYV